MNEERVETQPEDILEETKALYSLLATGRGLRLAPGNLHLLCDLKSGATPPQAERVETLLEDILEETKALYRLLATGRVALRLEIGVPSLYCALESGAQSPKSGADPAEGSPPISSLPCSLRDPKTGAPESNSTRWQEVWC